MRFSVARTGTTVTSVTFNGMQLVYDGHVSVDGKTVLFSLYRKDERN